MTSERSGGTWSRQLRQISKPTIRWSLAMLALLVVVTLVTYAVDPDVMHVLNAAEKKVSGSVATSTGMRLVLAFIEHNAVMVPLQMLVLSLIPIPFLFIVNELFSETLPGILYGVAFRLSVVKGISVLAPTIPTTILETVAFCAWIVLLTPVNRWIRAKCHHRQAPAFKDVALPALRGWVTVVLPILVVAAFCETYLDPIIGNLFP